MSELITVILHPPHFQALLRLLFFFAVAFTATRSRTRLHFVGIVSWIINKYLTWRYPIRSIDGGRPIPTCPYQWPNGQGDIGKFLEGERNSETWSKEHGRIYRIWSGTNPEIVVTHPDDIQAVFKDSDKHAKAENHDAGWLMGELLGRCLGLISGFEWQRVRTATSIPFTHKNAAKYTSRIIQITKDHFKDLHTTGELNQSLINPVEDLKFLPFWAVADILYGELTPEMKSELKDLIVLRESLWKRMIQGGIVRFSWARYLPYKHVRDLVEFKRRWAKFNDEAYEACVLAKELVPVVHMYEEVQKGGLEIEQIHQTLDEMLFANLDVTIGGISWNLLFLAANQDVQDQIRQEIFNNTKDEREHYLLSSSTLLAAAVQESARLKPLAAFSVPQSAPNARNVGGFLVPSGTNFIVDTYALNIRNPYWGEDNQAYRPSRFLEKKASQMRYQYWRFGFGPRQCLGRYAADIIIRTLLVHLMENHRLSLAHTTHWDKNPGTWITHPDTRIRFSTRSSYAKEHQKY
ncbi:cytochrome P450 [Zopfia rhizophila CBS 207.26]|uniref:Cytochrome P450 n=1 Tax=Zopfia rhizophila CBS 207.26 TaxID=1314779 RepID=A0A6A6DIA9_9PEZI|nr:cytochrome P450 [Zopfia rhizophila CBS 207.26]